MSDHALKINQLAAEHMPDRVSELAQLFPEAMTDGRIDVEKLRLLLGEQVEDSQERYGLTWPGKRDAIRLAQKQSTATLEPMSAESVDWDTTKNLIIEGDNLEVLKLLQKSYYGKVKLIYIDPPYNTGNDFVYNDDFKEPTDAYLHRSAQVDGQGFRTSNNKESSGRFHSDWLSMLHARLTVARNILASDGILAISIDDNESSRLRLLLEEVFGDSNVVAEISVSLNPKGRQLDPHFATDRESLFVVAKAIDETSLVAASAESVNESDFPMQDKVGKFRLLPLRNTNKKFNPATRPNLAYELHASPSTGRVSINSFVDSVPIKPVFGDGQPAVWRWGKKLVSEQEDQLFAKFVNGQTGRRLDVFQVDRLSLGRTKKLRTSWNSSDVGSTDIAISEVKDLFGQSLFSSPKPLGLLRRIAAMLPRDAVVLDFFAGSGTTAHAVMQQNAEDGGNRRFILVQLPEATENAEFPTISAITRERARRAGKKIKAVAGLTGEDLDVGFRAFKLGASNFRNWDVETDTLLAEDLEAFVDNINTNADDDGIVYEILLKAGIRLDTDLQKVSIAGADVTLAMDGLVAVSANRAITQEFIDGVLALEPPVQQLYLLDSGFGDNDSLKVNARHQFAARRSDSDPDKDDALRTV